MHTRQNELNKWLEHIFKNNSFTLSPLAGDASFRRYFRLQCGDLSYVVMDAPPEKESVAEFIEIGQKLAAIGIHTPAILTVEASLGFLLLEDLGDQLLLSVVSKENADHFYTAAMTTLLRLQQCSLDEFKRSEFNQAHMLQELSLFREWFLHAALGIELDATEISTLDTTFEWLTKEIAMQPQVLIHRDYHSRNLLIVGDKTPLDIAVIDFQDAMLGPLTYDLVSLLKDCYIQWPRDRVLHWLNYFYQKTTCSHLLSFEAFVRAFDLCGLQRHLKVLGIFCRLHLRDKKTAYLRDLPLTFHYVNACLESYPELQPLQNFIQKRVYVPFLEKYPC